MPISKLRVGDRNGQPASTLLKGPSFTDLGDAKSEPGRMRRQGFPEAIFCPGKTPDQIVRIFASLLKGSGPIIATRIPDDVAVLVLQQFPTAVHHVEARLVVAKPRPVSGRLVLVITAGTGDGPVAEEAHQTLRALGRRTVRLSDVGVSGIHRLLVHQKEIKRAAAVIVCAGMEGALASVVGGLAACPVIAVPTSIGYGAHLQGIAPLLTMINSCAANVSVVNIDNGFGAAVIASLIAK